MFNYTQQMSNKRKDLFTLVDYRFFACQDMTKTGTIHFAMNEHRATKALYEDFKSRMLQILLQKQCLQGKVKKCSEFNYNGIVVSDAKRPFFAFKFLSRETLETQPRARPRFWFCQVRKYLRPKIPRVHDKCFYFLIWTFGNFWKATAIVEIVL